MRNIIKIAARNLLRYKRRTLLTASLIMIGVVFVILFIAVSGSFKNMMIAQITDSMLGHIQIHKKGYVSSIENLPLNLSLDEKAAKKIETVLGSTPGLEAYSERIKFGGMFSNFTETTNIRLNAVYPEKEFKTVPQATQRLTTESKQSLSRGEIYIPDLLAKAMNVKIGDIAVIIATNKDGSVNGKQFTVAGILSSVTGPGGRDGYIHFDDGIDLLRMEKAEISEIAIRIKDFNKLDQFEMALKSKLGKPDGEKILDRTDTEKNNKGAGGMEVHTWSALSPFSNIANMIDVMTFFIKIMLIAIVMVSIMNVMIMAVYERIREIGTIAAIGTMPRKILSMFMVEGLLLGFAGSILGCITGTLAIFIINVFKIKYKFGHDSVFVLKAGVTPYDLIIITVIVVVISLIASVQPAFKASRMEPIEALKHV
jgi:putative ABC transport system permease protein